MGSDGYDYDGLERNYAGYVMTELTWNGITLIPGFRYEKEYTSYNGQRFQEVTNAGVQLPPKRIYNFNKHKTK